MLIVLYILVAILAAYTVFTQIMWLQLAIRYHRLEKELQTRVPMVATEATEHLSTIR